MQSPVTISSLTVFGLSCATGTLRLAVDRPGEFVIIGPTGPITIFSGLVDLQPFLGQSVTVCGLPVQGGVLATSVLTPQVVPSPFEFSPEGLLLLWLLSGIFGFAGSVSGTPFGTGTLSNAAFGTLLGTQ